MSYYHEARAIVKGMKDRVEVNKRNRERRAEQAGIEVRRSNCLTNHLAMSTVQWCHAAPHPECCSGMFKMAFH